MKKILSAVLACAATMSIATCAFATPAAPESSAPAATTKAPIKAENKVKVGKEGIQGADLEKAVLTVDKKQYKWSDVEEVTFTAETAFKITLNVKAGTVKGDDKATTFVVDKDELAKAAVVDGYDVKHTLTADLLAAVNAVEKPNVKIEGKDGAEVEVTAAVTIKADAKPVEPDAENKNTGIALAIAPAGLAVAFVTVAAVMSKKKKG